MTIEELHSPEPQRSIFRRRLRIPSLAELCWQEENWVSGERELSFRAGGRRSANLRRTLAGAARRGRRATGAGAGNTSYPPASVRRRRPRWRRYVMNELFSTICRRIAEAAEEETG